MALEETRGEQLQRLADQIERLRHDAAVWQTAGKLETARELRALATVLRGVVDAIVRAERTIDRIRPRRG